MSLSKTKTNLMAAAALIVLTAADLYTKHLAETKLAGGPFVLLKGIFEFRYLENHGMAFSLMQNQMAFFYIGTAVFLAAALCIWLKMPYTAKMRPLRVLLVFVCAGAVGNFIDRIRLAYVRDFLYFSLIDFPIFNVADIYVTVSAFVFFFLILFYYKDEDLSWFSFSRKEKDGKTPPKKDEA